MTCGPWQAGLSAGELTAGDSKENSEPALGFMGDTVTTGLSSLFPSLLPKLVIGLI